MCVSDGDDESLVVTYVELPGAAETSWTIECEALPSAIQVLEHRGCCVVVWIELEAVANGDTLWYAVFTPDGQCVARRMVDRGVEGDQNTFLAVAAARLTLIWQRRSSDHQVIHSGTIDTRNGRFEWSAGTDSPWRAPRPELVATSGPDGEVVAYWTEVADDVKVVRLATLDGVGGGWSAVHDVPGGDWHDLAATVCGVPGRSLTLLAMELEPRDGVDDDSAARSVHLCQWLPSTGWLRLPEPSANGPARYAWLVDTGQAMPAVVWERRDGVMMVEAFVDGHWNAPQPLGDGEAAYFKGTQLLDGECSVIRLLRDSPSDLVSDRLRVHWLA